MEKPVLRSRAKKKIELPSSDEESAEEQKSVAPSTRPSRFAENCKNYIEREILTNDELNAISDEARDRITTNINALTAFCNQPTQKFIDAIGDIVADIKRNSNVKKTNSLIKNLKWLTTNINNNTAERLKPLAGGGSVGDGVVDAIQAGLGEFAMVARGRDEYEDCVMVTDRGTSLLFRELQGGVYKFKQVLSGGVLEVLWSSPHGDPLALSRVVAGITGASTILFDHRPAAYKGVSHEALRAVPGGRWVRVPVFLFF